MINISINKRWLGATKKAWVERGNRAYRKRVYYMFEEMLLVSYQFSGDFTSNWRIITQADSMPSYVESPEKNATQVDFLLGRAIQPHRAGDAPAILVAREAVVRKPFSYNDKIYFVNPTPLHFTGTDVTGPDGVTRPLRPENVISSGQTIKAYMQSRFGGGL